MDLVQPTLGVADAQGAVRGHALGPATGQAAQRGAHRLAPQQVTGRVGRGEGREAFAFEAAQSVEQCR
jgi:hypothetical protein